MSTRSRICELDPTCGRARSIYCHFDGSPGSVGRTLVEHYNAPWRVSALMDLGDLSSLGELLAPDEADTWLFNGIGAHDPHKHDFEHRWPNVTVAYGRDRGEEHTECREVEAPTDVTLVAHELCRHQSDAAFVYVYDVSDGTWYYMPNGADKAEPLMPAVARIVEKAGA